METNSAVRALAALAQDHRLAIFRRLAVEGPSGMPAGDIAKAVGISPTSVSFHLKELDRAGLVVATRQGRFIRYAIYVDQVRQLLEFLTEDCCGGYPELCGGVFSKQKDFCREERE